MFLKKLICAYSLQSTPRMAVNPLKFSGCYMYRQVPHLRTYILPTEFIYAYSGHVERMVVERGVYRVLLGKPEGNRPLGRPRRRWVDNIRMDLQEVGCGYMDWIGLAQDRDRWRTLVSAVMNHRVP